MERTDKNLARKALCRRPDDANKGTMGTLLSVCGSYGMAGAAMLAAEAALRCGVGLNICALPRSIYPIAAIKNPECVYLPLDESGKGGISRNCTDFLLEKAKSADAVLLGCGLGVNDDSVHIVYSFLENCKAPLVLDADALNCVAMAPEVLKKASVPVIITPHPGEMGRLTRKTAAEVNLAREKAAAEFAREYGVITVLKGAGTIVASPDGKRLLNTTGNSGMATGGSGDVLAGMTASMLAQGAQPFTAAAAAVYLHGLAGDFAAERLGKPSMLPRDIIENIPNAIRACGVN